MKNNINISIDWTEKLQFTATNDQTTDEVAIAVQAGGTGEESHGTGPKHVFFTRLSGVYGGRYRLST